MPLRRSSLLVRTSPARFTRDRPRIGNLGHGMRDDNLRSSWREVSEHCQPRVA
jgi:hypothetical protein